MKIAPEDNISNKSAPMVVCNKAKVTLVESKRGKVRVERGQQWYWRPDNGAWRCMYDVAEAILNSMFGCKYGQSHSLSVSIESYLDPC